jgi:protein TonB
VPRTDLRADSLAGIVLGTKAPRTVGVLGIAIVGGVLLHVGLGYGAIRSGLAQARTTRPAPKEALVIDHLVELTPPEPPPPEPEPPPELPVAEKAPGKPPEPAPEPEPEAGPPPPAEAGQVVAAEENAQEPLDFTDFDLASGKGETYAGGVTASSGTNKQAVHTGHVDRNAKPGGPQGEGVSRARPVGMPTNKDWKCPWPQEADDLDIDEQTATIRVEVDATGKVLAATLVDDPGYGFGQVALTCARKQTFATATDPTGRPIQAVSPPIRVFFTRP